MKRKAAIAALLLAVAVAGLALWRGSDDLAPTATADEGDPRVAVEASPVTRGAVADMREFTGTIEAGQAFTVAPKTGGQIERVHVDIGDRVSRGQLLVELDDDEPAQAVAEADAELAVAQAELEQSRADARLAQRELERTETLAQRNLTSQSELDTARAEAVARETAIAVASARVRQREAAVARARVQLGYTDIRAAWPGSDNERLVGERLVNAGDTVGANTALLTVLSIAPITAAITVPEADYAPLRVDQTARVSTDAFPDRAFRGRVSRIAPQFARDSRQARVEIRVPNEERALKPGMFATVRITVDQVEDAVLIPREALVRVGDEEGVYRVIGEDSTRVRFQPVQVGIQGDDHLQVVAPSDLDGHVVTLGQQLLEDGSPVVVSGLPSS
ncbi:MAG: efflux RND transporter periplasmic adaptor subunit [Halofilum sp. (in: g-proteobacteria)]